MILTSCNPSSSLSPILLRAFAAYILLLQDRTQHKEASLDPSTSQTKHCIQQGKDCWYGELNSGLGHYGTQRLDCRRHRGLLKVVSNQSPVN